MAQPTLHTSMLKCDHCSSSLSLSFSLQAAWRNLWSCTRTNPAEASMWTGVRTVERACSPKILTNLFACKKHYLSLTHTSSGLQAPCACYVFVQTLLHVYMHMLVRVHRRNALTYFPFFRCSCASSYTGHRCMFTSDLTRTLPESEQLIAISCGVAMLISVLAVIIYCCAYKRWVSAGFLHTVVYLCDGMGACRVNTGGLKLRKIWDKPFYELLGTFLHHCHSSSRGTFIWDIFIPSISSKMTHFSGVFSSVLWFTRVKVYI